MVPRARFELAAKEFSCRIDEFYIHNPQCFCKLRTHPQFLPGYTIGATLLSIDYHRSIWDGSNMIARQTKSNYMIYNIYFRLYNAIIISSNNLSEAYIPSFFIMDVVDAIKIDRYR